MKKQTKLFFKFNKYSFIELIWTIISLSIDIITIYHWRNNLFSFFHVCVLIIFISITIFGAYRSYESFSTYKIRLRDYYRVVDMFSKGDIKKSILYNLQDTPCSATVAEQLVKDFNIKDVKLYTKDMKDG